MSHELGEMVLQAEQRLAQSTRHDCASLGREREIKEPARAGKGLSLSRRRAFKIIGCYYILYGCFLFVLWCAYWLLGGGWTEEGEGQSGIGAIRTSLLFVGWVVLAIIALAAGVGLFRLRRPARWAGACLALVFLIDGICRIETRMADVPSVLVFFVIPTWILSVLLSPWPAPTASRQS